MTTEPTNNTYYPPSPSWTREITTFESGEGRAQALVDRAAPPPLPLPDSKQLQTDFSSACYALGNMSRIDHSMAVDMAKAYIEDMKYKNQLASGDQEFNHARIMYKEKRAGWMMSAVLTTLIACGVLTGIFLVLSEMSKVAS
jgi:tetrahydromethanopterin S-methyltransferase subunit F